MTQVGVFWVESRLVLEPSLEDIRKTLYKCGHATFQLL